MMTKSRTISRTWQFLFTLLISIVGIASMIGSGGSGGSAATPPESVPPLAAITFPPPVSSTDGMTLTVTGTASDATGVAGVSVNGVDATTTDGFATWRAAAVPLMAGSNALTVSAVDDLGNTDAMAAEATVHVAADVSMRGVQFGDGYAVALDGTRAYVTDFDADQLVRVDLTNGMDVIISDNMNAGTGPDLDGPGGLALTSGLTTAWITNDQSIGGGLGELLSVNLTSGDRLAISDVNSVFFGPVGIALIDDTLGVVTNSSSASGEVLSVDLVNGNPTVLSATAPMGTGPEFDTPEGVAIDTANNRALVTDSFNDLLMAVDLTSGNRTVISNAALIASVPPALVVGTGLPFAGPIGVVLDSANGRALVVNNDSNVIIAVDLTTGASFGNRTIFSDANNDTANGTGPVLNSASGIALDGKDTAFVSGEKLWAVELGSGDRVIVGD